jgi:hypothetical protein
VVAILSLQMKMVFVNDGKMKLMQFSVQPTDWTECSMKQLSATRFHNLQLSTSTHTPILQFMVLTRANLLRQAVLWFMVSVSL